MKLGKISLTVNVKKAQELPANCSPAVTTSMKEFPDQFNSIFVAMSHNMVTDFTY